MPRRWIPVVLALVAVAPACTSPSAADRRDRDAGTPTGEVPRTSEPAASASQAVDRTRVRLQPPPGGSFLLVGRYPRVDTRCVDPERLRLVARYPGSLLVRLGEDGSLGITVTLPFESYLEGIAEVPPSWPRAALEAQAIAARSYALATTGWSGAEGEALAEPICATSSCQVYRGIPVPRDPNEHRWIGAVRRTAGLVLLDGERPATTVYFSTSNGRTYGNDEIFGSPPLPYLRPIVERDDGASPTSRWHARIPFRDLARFLRAAGAWPRSRRIHDVRLLDRNVVIRSVGSARRSIDLHEFADLVNEWAPCLEPTRYPPAVGAGGRLPLTIPSRWLRLSSTGDALLVSGRGWGHGVGMVQWGAYGKARRGFSAEEILAAYYGGLRPQPYPEPGLIHVQVASGLTLLRIVPSGSGAKLGGRALDGRIVIAGGDRLEVNS